MDPIIITVAPNGARKMKADHPAIPLDTGEIADEAVACHKAGAAMIHLHIRDKNKDYQHSLDVGIYREAIAEVKQQLGDDIIIQCTSEAVGIYNPEQQMAMVRELKPEAVSLAIREIIPQPSYESAAKDFLQDVLAQGTMPQYILYSPEEVKYFADLRKQGVIPGKKVFVLFVLGKKHAAAGDKTAWSQPDDLDKFLECFGKDLNLAETHWAVCAFGGNENACMEKAVACGGHPRIGFENNHLMENGEVAADNAALIGQFCHKLQDIKLSRKVADAQTARKLLKETLA